MEKSKDIDPKNRPTLSNGVATNTNREEENLQIFTIKSERKRGNFETYSWKSIFEWNTKLVRILSGVKITDIGEVFV